MDIQQQLDIVCLTHGSNIHLPTPPACAALMERAQGEGIPVGRLFVLSCELIPGVRGSYDRTTGDIWCHYSASDPVGDQSILRCLFTLIAHAKLRQPVPDTIEQDWHQEQMAREAAVALAREWGMEAVFPEAELSKQEQEAEHLLACHLAAGELAGNLDPFIARAAYHALSDIRHARGWTDKQFEAALDGCSEHEEENAAVLAFDRTFLRPTWSIPYRPHREGPPFGEWTLPQPVGAHYVLRHTLERTARARLNSAPQPFVEREEFEAPLHLHFLRVESDQDLTHVIATANMWLIEEGRDLVVRGMWWLYVGSAEHVYRLTVHYKPPFDDERATGKIPPARELWVLFPGGARLRNVEAAYQAYIVSWLRLQALHCEPLTDGLQLLWAYLGGN